MDLEPIPFDLISMLLREIGPATDLADEKGIDVTFSVAAKVPQFIWGDPVHVASVLRAVLHSAVQFTEGGAITLTVELLAKKMDATDFLPIQFSVNSTSDGTGVGAGISTDQHRTPTSFASVNSTAACELDATQEYLSHSKKSVEWMGGEIFVRSELGKGATLQFWIPFKVDQGVLSHSNRQARSHSHQLSLLCAEDFETNQIVIQTLLEEMGHTVTMVNNGIAAIESLMINQYDAILMDGRMPRMDGAQAATIIRRSAWNGRTIGQASIPIIALTANNSAEHKAAYFQAGMDDIVMKPIDSTALFNALEKVIHRLLDQGCLLKPMIIAESIDDLSGHGSCAALDDLLGLTDSALASPNTQNMRAANQVNVNQVNVNQTEANETSTANTILTNTTTTSSTNIVSAKEALHQKLLAAFRSSLPLRLFELNQALTISDFEALGRIFHGIKGSAAHLGDDALSAISGGLENAADAADSHLIHQRFADFEAATISYRGHSSV